MKRVLSCVGIVALACLLGACSAPSGSTSGDGGANAAAEAVQAAEPAIAINPSPDKYTWYVKSYVGMNASQVGYTALDGSRREYYGDNAMHIVFVSPDGTYINPQDEDILKRYRVVGQNLAPNTEIKYTYAKMSDGTELSNMVKWSSIDEIVLSVSKIEDTSGTTIDMTEIQAAPDQYHFYIKDYVGRNLAACGYISLGGELRDHVGIGNVKLDITADDGSYIDLSTDTSDGQDSGQAYQQAIANLSQYVVVGQNVAPNTEGTLTMVKDADGNEYDNLVDTQSIESVGLTVHKLDSAS